jgi:hypothetical protein
MKLRCHSEATGRSVEKATAAATRVELTKK